MVLESFLSKQRYIFPASRAPVVPSKKVFLRWVPGGSKYLLNKYDWSPRDYGTGVLVQSMILAFGTTGVTYYRGFSGFNWVFGWIAAGQYSWLAAPVAWGMGKHNTCSSA